MPLYMLFLFYSNPQNMLFHFGFVFVWMCATHVWWPEVNLQHLSSNVFLFGLRQCLSLAWSLWIRLDWLARESAKAGITSTISYIWLFTWLNEMALGSSCICIANPSSL